MFTFKWSTMSAAVGLAITISFGVLARPVDCTVPPQPTFTVSLPKLGAPPDDEGQGWDRPPVWAGHPGASDDSIEIPNGRPIYALLVSGYRQNAYLDQVIFHDFARHLMARGAYVHWAWWNNLLAPYMERPLHYSQSDPGMATDLTNFTSPSQAADKAVPGEDYQFVADAARLIRAIRANNPSATIIVAGHSMGGAAVVHLAKEVNDVVIDILAPIDPVGNRNYPWAGPVLYQGQYHYNWTRWRATRNNFLGYRDRLLLDGCDPSGPWLPDISDARSTCPAGVQIHDASALRIGSNVINLYHRWQNEARFPFDFNESYSFTRTTPTHGTSTQSAVTTRAAGSDPGGWPVGGGGTCCPVGPGVSWPGDGHGEIVGYRGPLPTPEPLAVRVSTSPQCSGCPGLTWPARTHSGGTWSNGNASSRRSLLQNLESLPLNQTWAHEPYNPDLCLVSPGLISRFNSMNKPPVADAGPDQTVTCDGCKTGVAILDGSASSDPDGEDLDYRWQWLLGSATGEMVDLSLPIGSHCITLEVEDPSGHIARDVVAITIVDPSAAVVPYTSLATSWRDAAGDFEGHAFDEFFHGVPDATRCLLNAPTQPTAIMLTGGTLTVSAHENSDPYCAITDASTPPAVSDAHISGLQSVVAFAFEPPVSAFYTYYGSLATGRTATMALYDTDGMLVESLTTPPSTHSPRAAGQGFTATVPIARIEFTSSEPGSVLVGTFTGLRPGEQSLGTVDLGDYDGPGGSGITELDFACTFARACTADFNDDGAVNSQDFFDFLTAFFAENPSADFNNDTLINSQDFFDFLAAFFVGC